MTSLTRQQVLTALIQHTTLTDDNLQRGSLGFLPNPFQLKFILQQLLIQGHIRRLSGISPITYTLVENEIVPGTGKIATTSLFLAAADNELDQETCK